MSQMISILLDAPTQATSRIPVARLGSYNDKRYGDFSITAKDVEEWQKNLERLPGGRALIDEDHLANKASPHRRTEASGWLNALELEGKQVYGQVEWTPKGRAAVEEKRYLFTSPTYGPFTDDSGTTYDNTLSGLALTNRPYLTSQPQISLASDEAISRALEADPAAALYQRALDGELGEDVRQIALAASPEDADVTAAISAASAAVHKALNAQRADPDPDTGDQSVLSALRRAAADLDAAEAAQKRDTDGAKAPAMRELDDTGAVVSLDALSTNARNNLSASDFALSGRRYPIHDLAHARNALARVAQNGSSDEQAKVKAAVYRKFPELQPSAKKLHSADRRGQMFTQDTVKSLASIAGITDEAKIDEIVTLAAADGTEESKVLEAIETAKPEPEPVKTLEELAEAQGVKLLSADEHQTLTDQAAEAARLKAEKPAETEGKTLDQLAEESGKVLLDASQVDSLQEAASKVPALELTVRKLDSDAKDAAKALSDNRFSQAFDKAVSEGKAAPAQEERWKGFYELDAENTLTMLAEQPQAFNVRPQGRNVSPAADAVPEGQHPQHHELEQRVTAYAEEHKVDYFKALEAVSGVSIPGMAI